ncbi:ATP synthase F1 subunit gamma [Chryseolinea lacunae]|uniref:ATP synthase gamma chain n=1 Tax=Chryseolinea lacunae TaxID=2801331 RepID=A0ABS1KS78_9BACT|nr:ATP synthase F1 subunit gamma [Chryseolinea lacunae]MBL0742163.1 ATP synthase F1 subunit gamma [Chryseolinea lacunae]
MPNLKEVKNRITSVMSTQQITKAMKMVAAAKLRKSQERITQMRPYAQKLNAILKNLSEAQLSGDNDNWYSQVREEKRILILTVSSDRGLCGSFNTNVMKGVIRLIQEKYEEQSRKGNVVILPIGRKAAEFFGKRNMELVGQYSNLFSTLTFEQASLVGEHVMNAFREGKFDKVELVYNEFKNVATQILRTEQLLPVVSPEPVVGASSNQVDYIYQPSQQEIVEALIPNSLKVQIFKALLDSNAAENGARMTAMDKATENAGELLKELKLSYNRSRQAAITKEILEIVGGAEALKSA